MRGKKSDPIFVSQYIRECIDRGLSSSEDILTAAKQDIASIDDTLREIQTLKLKRSQLLDVIARFDKAAISDNEKQILSLFDLQYPQTCHRICSQILLSEVYHLAGIKDAEILFCIKQLVAAKVLVREENILIKGEKFDDYTKLVCHLQD